MQNQIKLEITASAVAWYGAIVATITLFIGAISTFYRIWQDKRRIKVHASEMRMISSYNKDNKLKIVLKAINVGHKVVTLTHAGFQLDNRKDILVFPTPDCPKFPFELGGGKYYITWVNKEDLSNMLKNEKSKIKYVWFIEATSKRFKTLYKLK